MRGGDAQAPVRVDRPGAPATSRQEKTPMRTDRKTLRRASLATLVMAVAASSLAPPPHTLPPAASAPVRAADGASARLRAYDAIRLDQDTARRTKAGETLELETSHGRFAV